MPVAAPYLGLQCQTPPLLQPAGTANQATKNRAQHTTSTSIPPHRRNDPRSGHLHWAKQTVQCSIQWPQRSKQYWCGFLLVRHALPQRQTTVWSCSQHCHQLTITTKSCCRLGPAIPQVYCCTHPGLSQKSLLQNINTKPRCAAAANRAATEQQVHSYKHL